MSKPKQILAELDRVLIQSGHLNAKVGELYVALGQAVEEERLLAGVSARELARRLGCSAVFLRDMETGKRRFNLYWVHKVETALARLGPHG